MACIFLNKSAISLNRTNYASDHTRNWSECYKGLDEYESDEELANVQLFLDYPEPLLTFAAACTIIFMIISVPGNMITIIALSSYRKVRNATAFFIINLSVADLLFSCTVLPITIQFDLKQSWTTGKYMCRIHPILMYGLTATSLFTVAGITINRYVMVSHPLLYPKMYRNRNLIIMIIATWVSAFSMIVPTTFEVWGRFSLDPRVGFCTIILDKNGHSPKSTIILFAMIFPLFCIVICYTRIMYIVKKSTANCKIPHDTTSSNQEESARTYTSTAMKKSEEEDSSDDEETNDTVTKFNKSFKSKFGRKPRRVSLVPTKRDQRLQSMIIAIIIVYFMCHLPVMIAKTTSNVIDVGPYGHIIGIVLLNMTVCVNPIIYVAISREYREAYRSVFGF